MTRGELQAELATWSGAIVERLRVEVAREISQQINAAFENLRGYIGALVDKTDTVDQKYAGLPPRVEKVERKVFARTKRR